MPLREPSKKALETGAAGGESAEGEEDGMDVALLLYEFITVLLPAAALAL